MSKSERFDLEGWGQIKQKKYCVTLSPYLLVIGACGLCGSVLRPELEVKGYIHPLTGLCGSVAIRQACPQTDSLPHHPSHTSSAASLHCVPLFIPSNNNTTKQMMCVLSSFSETMLHPVACIEENKPKNENHA